MPELSELPHDDRQECEVNDAQGCDDTGNSTSCKPSQATRLVELVLRSAEPWHTPAGDAYLTARVEGHPEHFPLGSRAAKDYLTRLFYRETGRAPISATASTLTAATPAGRPSKWTGTASAW